MTEQAYEANPQIAVAKLLVEFVSLDHDGSNKSSKAIIGSPAAGVMGGVTMPGVVGRNPPGISKDESPPSLGFSDAEPDFPSVSLLPGGLSHLPLGFLGLCASFSEIGFPSGVYL